MNDFLKISVLKSSLFVRSAQKWLAGLVMCTSILTSTLCYAATLPPALPGQYKQPAPANTQPNNAVDTAAEIKPAVNPNTAVTPLTKTIAPEKKQATVKPTQSNDYKLTSTEDISEQTDEPKIKALSAFEKAANEKAINNITNIKKSPLANPNAALMELAFKFGKRNKHFAGFDKVYENYCSKASNGDANAQYALGWLHEYGKGVPVDKPLAKVFYGIAAEQDHSLALKSLPRLDSEIEGVLPKCMFPEPVVYVVEAPKLTREQLAENERKAQIALAEEEKRQRNMARAERIFKRQKSIYRIVKRLSKKYAMDPKLIMSFIAIESAFDVTATSPKNAQGLMQLIPKTARRFGVKNAYDAKQNIRGGIKYIRWLLAYYEGNVELAAAAYNAGERAVDRYKGVPPYKETQNYVKRLYRLYNKTEHPYKASLVKQSSPILLSYINNKK